MFGSWARRELVATSDEDWLLLVGDDPQPPPRRAVEEIETLLRESPSVRPGPGSQNIFGTYAYMADLKGKIGLDPDDNANLTRRVLYLLESVPIKGEDVHRRFLQELLEVYIPDTPFPRFLLNDVVRYWRTICVDFAGKELQGTGPGWGLRNAKLRNSRKLLFASGLLPILLCDVIDPEVDRRTFLFEQLGAPAVDRVAFSYLIADELDAGARALSAYDSFLALLSDADRRAKLKEVGRDDAASSPEFQYARTLGRQLQTSLLSLLFETDIFKRAAREYAIF
jgi:hypothetical protein